MKKYNEFIQSRLNEEQDDGFGGTSAAKGIGGLFKNLLGGLLKDVKDELKKPVEELNKKLGNQKDIKDMAATINKYLLQHRETLVNSLEQATTIPAIVEVIGDNIRVAYASIESSVKNLSSDTYTFEEIFKNAPERTKKLFINPRKFDNRIEQFTKDLVLSLGKPFGVTEDDVNKTVENAQGDKNSKKIDKVANGENVQGTEKTTGENVQGTEKAAGETSENQHLHQDYKDKLYEAKGDPITEDDIKKLKEVIINWFDDAIYKTNKNMLDETAKQGNNPKQEDINAKIDAITVTDKKDSVKAIMNKITEVDKNTMIQVRDLLGLTKKDTPL